MWVWLSLVACTQTQLPETAPADRCAAGAIPAGQPLAMRVDDGKRGRGAIVWFPSGAGPHDVVVNLHEFNANPERQANYSGWIAEAERVNAILVGPDGKTATWNAGACCGKAMERNIDDVAYLDALVARVDAVGCTTGRVLVTGIGAGAMMAHRWACESDVPDALVSVGGELQRDACLGKRPIPALMLHGAHDRWMPMDGSGGHSPTIHAVAQWRLRDRAAPVADPVRAGLVCRRWEGEAPVELCVVEGMGDRWPGASDSGTTVDATALSWAWTTDAWAQVGTVPR